MVHSNSADHPNVIKVILGGQNNLKPYEIGTPSRVSVYAASANYSDSLSTEETCSLSCETQELIALLCRLLKPGQGNTRGHPVPNFASASDCSSLFEVQQAVHSRAVLYQSTEIHVLASSAGTRAVTPLLLLLRTFDPDNRFPIKSSVLFAPAAPLYHFGILDALVEVLDTPIAMFTSAEDVLCKCTKGAFRKVSLVHFEEENMPLYLSQLWFGNKHHSLHTVLDMHSSIEPMLSDLMSVLDNTALATHIFKLIGDAAIGCPPQISSHTQIVLDFLLASIGLTHSHWVSSRKSLGKAFAVSKFRGLAIWRFFVRTSCKSAIVSDGNATAKDCVDLYPSLSRTRCLIKKSNIYSNLTSLHWSRTLTRT